MPTSFAFSWRSCFDQSPYFDDSPPFLPVCERSALAMRAAFSLLAPSRRRASYCSSSLTLDPWSLATAPPPAPNRLSDLRLSPLTTRPATEVPVGQIAGRQDPAVAPRYETRREDRSRSRPLRRPVEAAPRLRPSRVQPRGLALRRRQAQLPELSPCRRVSARGTGAAGRWS